MRHYNVEKLSAPLQEMIKNDELIGPMFVGQGLTQRVGSDSYGYYVVDIKTLKNGKKVVGIVSADSTFEKCWEDGNMTCSADISNAKPEQWITTYGVNRRTGNPQWYYCHEDGNRDFGNKCTRKAFFSWNGAYAYRDPSF